MVENTNENSTINEIYKVAKLNKLLNKWKNEWIDREIDN